ncbi:MAG: YcgL domain-containing protein [Cellvibrionaceae bacterium]
MKKILCNVYRCAKKEGMYVYMAKQDGLDTLPDALKQRTGRMELAMTLLITPDKKLARATAEDVLIAIDNQGFYLQMPPSMTDEMQSVSQANTFIKR